MADHKESGVIGLNQGPQRRDFGQGLAYTPPYFQTISAAKPAKKRGNKPAPTRNKTKELRPFATEDCS